MAAQHGWFVPTHRAKVTVFVHSFPKTAMSPRFFSLSRARPFPRNYRLLSQPRSLRIVVNDPNTILTERISPQATACRLLPGDDFGTARHELVPRLQGIEHRVDGIDGWAKCGVGAG